MTKKKLAMKAVETEQEKVGDVTFSEKEGFVHEKKAFLKSVSYLRPLFKSKVSASIKVFERVVFEKGLMSAFDGQVLITVRSPWGDYATGSCRGVVLYDLLNSFPAEEIQSRFEGNEIIFTGGTSRASTAWMEATEEDKKTRQFMLGWPPDTTSAMVSLKIPPQLFLVLRAALLSAQNVTYHGTSGVWFVFDAEKKMLTIWASDAQTLLHAEMSLESDVFAVTGLEKSFTMSLSSHTAQLLLQTFEQAEHTLMTIYEGGIEVSSDEGVSFVSSTSPVDESFLTMAEKFVEKQELEAEWVGRVVLNKGSVQSIKQSKEVERLDDNTKTTVVFGDGAFTISTIGATISIVNELPEEEVGDSIQREYVIQNLASLMKSFDYFNQIEFSDNILLLKNTQFEAGMLKRYVRVEG